MIRTNFFVIVFALFYKVTPAHAMSQYLVCRHEYIAHCRGQSWQEVVERRYSCLRDNISELGTPCTRLLLKMSGDSCLGDVILLCKLQGRLLERDECLASDLSLLSIPCRRSIEATNKSLGKKDAECNLVLHHFCPGLTDADKLKKCRDENLFRFSAKCLLKMD